MQNLWKKKFIYARKKNLALVVQNFQETRA